jgi:hypothetical protein
LRLIHLPVQSCCFGVHSFVTIQQTEKKPFSNTHINGQVKQVINHALNGLFVFRLAAEKRIYLLFQCRQVSGDAVVEGSDTVDDIVM